MLLLEFLIAAYNSFQGVTGCLISTCHAGTFVHGSCFTTLHSEKWTEKYPPLISAQVDSEALKLVTREGFGITVLGDFQVVAKQRHS